MEAMYPDIIMLVGIIVVFILDLFLSEDYYKTLSLLGGAFSFLSAIFCLKAFKYVPFDLMWRQFNLYIHINSYVLVGKLFIYLITGFIIIASADYFLDKSSKNKELVYIYMTAALGLSLTFSSKNLVLIFSSLELASLSMYLIAGIFKDDYLSKEGSFKYLILGSFATVNFVLGAAFYLLSTNSLNIEPKSVTNNTFLALSAIFLFSALLLKVSSFPFHFWTPDTYEGAPTPSTAFLSTVPKISFFFLLTIFFTYIFPAVNGFSIITQVVGIVSMFYGSFVAYNQSSVKRMLAYSSIAHAGYFLIGLSSYNQFNIPAVLFYVITYSFATAGSFLILSVLERKVNWRNNFDDFRGLYRSQPVLAFTFAILIFALIGIPPFALFFGKLGIFLGLVKDNLVFTAFLFVIGSVVGAGYYLKLLVYIFLKDRDEKFIAENLSFFEKLSIGAFAFLVVIFGIFPNFLIDLIFKGIFHE